MPQPKGFYTSRALFAVRYSRQDGANALVEGGES